MTNSMGVNTEVMVNKVIYERKAHDSLVSEITNHGEAFLSEIRLIQKDNNSIIRALVRSPKSFSVIDMAIIESKLPLPSNQLPIDSGCFISKLKYDKNWPHIDSRMSQLSSVDSIDQF